jgi:hypothetical protein
MILTEFHQSCPNCGGPAFSDLILAEKKDACYYKVKASAKVWPSAYASGRLVQCRKKGAANYGNKNESQQQLDEKCWDGYQQQGMKNKGGRQVPNCVPTESVVEAGSPAQQAAIAIAMKKKGNQPMNEYNAEYDDEAGMADNNLETLERAVRGIDDLIQSGDNLPEWCQEKIAVAKSMLVSVWDYMYSEEASDEVDPEVDEMFEAMTQLVAEMAQKNRVSEDLVWETFEALPDNVLYETAAWRRKEGKSKKGGLNAKGVASYRRENPGSKLQMAVTTKPSKLKPGSKAAKRRKSFCARMSGVKGPMKKPNGKPTRKALALRKWNC